VEQISTCSPWKGPHTGTGGCLKEAVTPWGVGAGAGSCQDLQTRRERSPRRSRFAGRACDPMGDPHWSSLFLKDCTSWKGPTLGQFVKSCSPWEGLTLEQGQSVRSPPPEEEGEADTTCVELTTTPIPHPPAPLEGRRERKIGSKVKPGNEGGVGRRRF